MPLKDTDHIFEIGCGTGAMSAYLAREIVPNGQVTACDPEENRIRFAKQNFAEISNLKFIHATGAVALENKENVYDVIVSNAVLHWIKQDELEKTLEKMFTALKPGGISGHNFNEGIPNTYKTLGKIDASKLEEFLKVRPTMLKEEFAEMSKKVGFVVLDSGKVDNVTQFETEEEILKLVDATTYGLFGWERLYKDAKEKGKKVKFDMSKTGKLKHISKLVHFILKKS